VQQIRHAEGYHNLRVENHNIRDPLLTPMGEQQCDNLSTLINSDPNICQVDCIIASPMRRTLYTALRVFQNILASRPHMRILAVAELQETSALPCDTGLPLDELQKEFKDQPVDFSFVPVNWNDKVKGPFASRSDVIATRARNARQFLHSRHEKEVAVVTHGAFLHYLTGDWAGSRDGCGE
jgi:broad specificity phosphatase PhoE